MVLLVELEVTNTRLHATPQHLSAPANHDQAQLIPEVSTSCRLVRKPSQCRPSRRRRRIWGDSTGTYTSKPQSHHIYHFTHQDHQPTISPLPCTPSPQTHIPALNPSTTSPTSYKHTTTAPTAPHQQHRTNTTASPPHAAYHPDTNPS